MGKLYGALMVLSLIWGTSFLFIKILLEEIEPAAVVFGRCLFGVAPLALIVLFKSKKIAWRRLPLKKLILVGFLNNALPWLLISVSETMISSGMASVLNATTPIWTLLIGSLFFAAVLGKNQWIGIGIGFIGILILSDFHTADLLSGNTYGVFLMSGAAFCYGAGTHLTKKYLAEVSTLHISLFTLLAAAIISFFAMRLLSSTPLYKFMEMNIFLPLIGLGAFGSGIAYLLYYYLVKEGSPEFASLVTYIVPASAIIWGAMLLNEQIHLSMIVGLIIIFAGVYVTSKKERQTGRKAAA
ncbi:DMT family transporter [Cytobacillus sp. NCCP-133]|uniref:DMT family transporter n=1 Tax=Cytobacillus sp. NCCP-133 TaxID=766848 RepID=UPI0022322C9F|nr:DMT family transporter [Cytobacillus sp. NCCP-133]GLB60377.1 transporter [Cytobacillus sp. NCCP-133]